MLETQELTRRGIFKSGPLRMRSSLELKQRVHGT
jgi:hypothetical protein